MIGAHDIVQSNQTADNDAKDNYVNVTMILNFLRQLVLEILLKQFTETPIRMIKKSTTILKH